MLRALLAFLLLFFAACTKSQQDDAVFFTTPQSGKVTSWKDKLQKAEKDLVTAQKNVGKYQTKLYREQLKVIKKHIAECETRLEKISSDPQKYAHLLQEELSNLFLEEREELLDIMQSQNEKLAKEAEDTLNHILRLITQLGTKRED